MDRVQFPGWVHFSSYIYRMEEYKHITLETLTKAVREFYEAKGDGPGELRIPSVTNQKWTDEEGNNYSSWKIDNGRDIIHTGDGGMELLQKAFEDAVEKNIEKDLESPKE